MTLNPLKSIYTSVPLVVAAAVIAVSGVVYFGHVSAQRDYLRDRDLRQLLVIGDQLKRRIADLAAVLSHTPGLKDHGSSVFSPGDYLRVARFRDTTHGHSPRELGFVPPVGKRDTTCWTQTWLVRSGDTLMVQLVNVDTSRDSLWETVAPMVDLRELLEPSLAWTVFDDILLASHSGKVAYQHSSGGARINRIDSLLDSQGNPIKFSLLAGAASVADLVLAGTEYKLFCQPIMLPPDRTDSSAGSRRWSIYGLVEIHRFNKEANELPIPFAMTLFLLLVLVSFSWPFLKIWSLSASERPSRLDVLFAVMALLFGTALGTFVLMSVLSTYDVVSPDLDNHLSTLSNSIEKAFHEELNKAVKQLDSSSVMRGLRGQVSRKNQVKILSPSQDSIYVPRIYRNAGMFYWVKSDGMQVAKWSIDTGVTPLIDVSTREYFRALKEGRFFRLRPDCDSFAVEPHYSWTTGTFQLAISRFDQVSEAGEERFAVLDTRPLSLVQPVLVPGYTFCVIDQWGKVLFHSIEGRNLWENLFNEIQPDRSLRAAVSVRSATYLDVSYWGLDQRMYVRPMSSLPWFLVVLREETSLWTLNLEVLTWVIVLFAISLVGPTAVFFWMCRKTRWTATWAWPAFGKTDVYWRLLHVYLVTLLALIGFGPWQEEHPVHALLSVVVFASLLVWVTGNCLDAKRLRRLSDRRDMYSILTWIGAVCWPLSYLAVRQQESTIPLVGDAAPILLMELFLFGAGILYMLPPPCRATRPRMPMWEAVRSWLEGRTWLKILPRLKIPTHLEIPTWLGFNRVYTLCGLLLTLLVAVYPAFVFFRVSYDVQARLLIKHAQQELGQSLHSRERRVRERYRSLPDSLLASFLKDSTGIYTNFFFGTTRERASKPDSCLCWKPERETGQWGGRKPWLQYRLMAPYNATSTVLRELLGDVTIDSAFAWIPMSNGRLMFHGEDLRSASAVHLVTTVPTLLHWVDLHDARSNVRLLVWIGVICVFAILLYFLLRMALRGLYLIDESAGRRLPAPQPRGEGCSGNILLLSTHRRADIPWLKTRDFCHIDMAARPWGIGLGAVRRLKGFPPGKAVLVDHLEFEMESVDTNVLKLELIEEIIYVYRRPVVLLSVADPLGSFALRREGRQKTEPSSEDYTSRWKAVLSGCARVHVDKDDGQGASFKGISKEGLSTQPVSHERDTLQNLSEVILDECSHFAELRPIGQEVFKRCTVDPDYAWSSVVRDILDRARPYYHRLWTICTLEERRVLLDAAWGEFVSYSNLSVVRGLEERGLLRRSPNLNLMNESFGMFLRSLGPEKVVRYKGGEAEVSDWKRMRVAFLTLLVAVVLFLYLTQREVIGSAMAFISVVSALLPGIFKLVGFITAKEEQS